MLQEIMKKYNVFKALNLANFWIYGWATVGIVVLSTDIVSLVFGSNYKMHMGIPIILAINFYMLGMQCVVGIYTSTMGLFKYGQYILLLTAVINLIGDFVLGKRYGVMGIFAATVISRLITNTWYGPFVIYKFGFQKDFKKYIVRYMLYAGVLTITCSICYGLSTLVTCGLISTLIVKFVICIVIPNSFFAIVFHRWEEFQYFAKMLKRIRENVVQKIKG